jgi:hypothetical protein
LTFVGLSHDQHDMMKNDDEREQKKKEKEGKGI